MGDNRSTLRFWRGNVKEKDHLEGLAVDGRIILKSILKK
jgi:hypothetical protein